MENVPRGTFSIGPFNHSHNPPQYSHIVGYTFHFYAHIGGGPKVFHPLMSKLMWVLAVSHAVGLKNILRHQLWTFKCGKLFGIFDDKGFYRRICLFEFLDAF